MCEAQKYLKCLSFTIFWFWVTPVMNYALRTTVLMKTNEGCMYVHCRTLFLVDMLAVQDLRMN